MYKGGRKVVDEEQGLAKILQEIRHYWKGAVIDRLT